MNIINQHTKICMGKDALDILKNIKKSKILIVSDEFLVKNSMIKKITQKLDYTNKIEVFDRVKPDPSLSIVSDAIKTMVDLDATHIIGFGGGSAIDTAKGVIYFLRESKRIEHNIEFIAIPTTSGTGSEVTSVTVLTDEQKQTKHLIESDDILPDVAILDAEFTMSLPKSIIANTGIDVLTHIIEAYVAKGANEYSDALAEKSGDLLIKYLYESYSNDKNDIAREKVHIASNLAGTAFNIAGVGLNHSIAHQIGGFYHIPHGLANAILLKEVIDFNATDKAAKQRYIKFARRTGMAGDNLDDNMAFSVLKEYISVMMKLMDMPDKISKCNIDKELWDKNKTVLAKNALKDNCLKYNPKSISEKEIVAILEKIY